MLAVAAGTQAGYVTIGDTDAGASPATGCGTNEQGFYKIDVELE